MVKEIHNENSIEVMEYLSRIEALKLDNKLMVTERNRLVRELDQLKVPLALIGTRFMVELTEIQNETNKNYDIYEDLPISHILATMVRTSDDYIVMRNEEVNILVDLIIRLLRIADSNKLNEKQTIKSLKKKQEKTNFKLEQIKEQTIEKNQGENDDRISS